MRTFAGSREETPVRLLNKMFFAGVLMLTLATRAIPVRTGPAGKNPGCSTSPAVVGGRGTMTFTFRPGLDMSSDSFHAYVIQSGKSANVIGCDRTEETDLTCEVFDKAFNPTQIVNRTLTLTAEDVSLDLAGVYTLRSIVGGSNEPAIACTFVVLNATDGISGDTADQSTAAIVVPIVCILLVIIIIIAVVVFLVYKRRKRMSGGGSNTPIQLSDQQGSGTTDPMLPADQSDSCPDQVENKRWYFGKISQKKEAELAKFWRNGKGSFLIRKDSEQYFTLAVLDEHGKIRRPRIVKNESGYTLSETVSTFTTLIELVAHYKENEIVIKAHNFGKLVKPFEEKPNEVWYAGKMDREAEERLLTEEKPGSFLIRDNITYPQCYTLAVNVGGERESFRISLDDENFILSDANGRKTFKSLAELVHYYQENTLDTVRGDMGKLGRPISCDHHTAIAFEQADDVSTYGEDILNAVQ